jgi:hypothetical protein
VQQLDLPSVVPRRYKARFATRQVYQSFYFLHTPENEGKDQTVLYVNTRFLLLSWAVPKRVVNARTSKRRRYSRIGNYDYHWRSTTLELFSNLDHPTSFLHPRWFFDNDDGPLQFVRFYFLCCSGLRCFWICQSNITAIPREISGANLGLGHLQIDYCVSVNYRR